MNKKLSPEEIQQLIDNARRNSGRPQSPALPPADNPFSWRRGTFSAEALQNETFPPLKWIVPNMIPAEGTSLLCSKPKFGKSWLVLDLCLGCTSDRYILDSVKPLQGDVLYLALEDSKRRLRRRMTKLLPTGARWPSRLTIKTDWRRLHEGGLADIRAWHDETRVLRDNEAECHPPRPRQVRQNDRTDSQVPVTNEEFPRNGPVRQKTGETERTERADGPLCPYCGGPSTTEDPLLHGHYRRRRPEGDWVHARCRQAWQASGFAPQGKGYRRNGLDDPVSG